MAVITWNAIADRKFQSGLDRGVLYVPDGEGVPWNGLISVSDRTANTIEPLYFDGRKYNDLIVVGDFTATLRAFTYPDEFCEFEGTADIGNGISLLNQRPKRFGLSYRTMIGNALDGAEAGYKIHVLYNLLAAPSGPTFDSHSDEVSFVTFEWTITSVPVEVSDHMPVAHIVIDSLKTPPDLVQEIEDLLYGTISTASELPAMSYFIGLALTEV